MKIIIAKNAGFCPGVNNAINKVIELSEHSTKKIYTLGQLIHNNDVIKNLEERGIVAVNSISEINDIKTSILVIRAHGIPPELEEKIKESGIEYVDATCPLVKNAHRIIKEYSEKGYTTIILGDKEHAEVIGLKGYAGDNCFVISSVEEAEKLPDIEKANLVSQTTQEEELFERVVKILTPKIKELIISNTICTPTKLRQKETIEFSKIADIVVVIGGKHSANTQRLYQICKDMSKEAVLVENENDITDDLFKDKNTVFITAGASTPAWLISGVEKKIRGIIYKENIFKKFFKFIVASGIFTGFAALGLISVVYKSFKTSPDIKFAISLSLVLMAAHIINRSSEKEANENNFRKTIFLKYNREIRYIAYISIILSILLSLNSGILYTILILLFALPAMAYRGIKKSLKISAIKDIFITLGWVYIICFIPAIRLHKLSSPIFYSNILLIFTASLIRNIFIGILQKKNDMIITNEYIYFCLGEKRTFKLLYIILLVLLFISIPYCRYFSIPILFLPVYYFIMIFMMKKGKSPDIILSEFLIELPFFAIILV
jgi:(E)-4-hydroxy-3-methyl-but-2-enyl pyrophosphate reductase